MCFYTFLIYIRVYFIVLQNGDRGGETEMIPRKIHYCWFGHGEKSKLAQKCIASWKKFCPDYEFIEWNEDNFDIHCCPYVEEAYENKRFAFVTDYVRLYAMYTQGGIYMDTDVEVIRSLDEFLSCKAFSGFESTQYVPTGIMASEKGTPIIRELMEDYNDRHFINEDGTLDTTTNCTSITNIMLRHGLRLDGQLQTIKDFTFYPPDYFCPFENETGILRKTANTAAIHWFNKSWLPQSVRVRTKITRIFHRLFGVDCFKWLKRKKS